MDKLLDNVVYPDWILYGIIFGVIAMKVFYLIHYQIVSTNKNVVTIISERKRNPF